MALYKIIANECIRGDYYRIKFHAPEISRLAVPGQFVHVRIDERLDNILRRPFSICDTNPQDGTMDIVYKVVGTGTRILRGKKPGESCDVIGPLGKGFSPAAPDTVPVVVAGGYGNAATYMLTKTCAERGFLLFGARGSGDIILADDYRKAGFQTRIATNDGSFGHKGFVTELIKPLLDEHPAVKFMFYGCGPLPMLNALAKELVKHGQRGELSVDQIMCCGIGACYGCVVKLKNNDGGQPWKYARSCADGPVFNLDEYYVE